MHAIEICVPIKFRGFTSDGKNRDQEQDFCDKNMVENCGSWYGVDPHTKNVGTNYVIQSLSGCRYRVGSTSPWEAQLNFSGCLVDDETECITNPAGNGYSGTLSTAADESQCLNWAHVNDYAVVATMPIRNISQVANYCRRLPTSKWHSVTCFVSPDNKNQAEKPCHVEFCGKKHNELTFTDLQALCFTRIWVLCPESGWSIGDSVGLYILTRLQPASEKRLFLTTAVRSPQ